jgi:glutathione S-transferase
MTLPHSYTAGDCVLGQFRGKPGSNGNGNGTSRSSGRDLRRLPIFGVPPCARGISRAAQALLVASEFTYHFALDRANRSHAGAGDDMVQLVAGDIGTSEVLDWKGVHVLHFSGSSCSQKLRVFLNLKGIAWESHLVDLHTNENFSPWFLGINPRGLVPVLVHDGAVHIESNDIISYLEETFPGPRLIPAGREGDISALLAHEDDLHLDLRTLSFRFVFAPPGPPKPAEALARYAANGSGTVRGMADRDKAIQLEFWQRAAKEGFTDQAARASAQKFRTEFDALDRRLSNSAYLLGEELSVLDIAWFIYANRLSLAGYPFARLHPRVAAWAATLGARPEFAREVAMPPQVEARIEETRRAHAQAGKSFEMVAGF